MRAFFTLETMKPENSIFIIEIGKMPDPVPQSDGIFSLTPDLKFFQNRLMAMPQDHSVNLSLYLRCRKSMQYSGKFFFGKPGWPLLVAEQAVAIFHNQERGRRR